MNLAEIRKKAQKERICDDSASSRGPLSVEKGGPEEIPSPVEREAVLPVPVDCRETAQLAASEIHPQLFDPLAILLAGRREAGSLEGQSPVLGVEVSTETDAVLKYLCFRVDAEQYALNLMDIKEIIKPREITEVPHTPPFIKGIISLRGMIIPMFDLRLRLGFPEAQPTGRERFVIVKHGEGLCGLRVDEVYQVITLAQQPIERPPAVLDGMDREFVSGIGRHEEHVFILMDLEKVLDISLL